MALTKCPECTGAVSEKAAACPRCGYPLAQSCRGGAPAQIIEKTAKGWKAVRVLGWVLILGGVLVLRDRQPTHQLSRAPAGWWITGAGVACLIASKLGAWWYHG